ncbi:MAG: hypothetical protein FJZ00_06495 [Candidatus Sericytochromatia bacterium]|uniref:Uncharacterized protein n=1 Tax=Candidatus Tanganyikabacteria bacterium TaxID=2961651 RepID=A0A937X5P8_9BACT|nr:hypothetical protein [Candidatus Tanganyikabacteria bacterium]
MRQVEISKAGSNNWKSVGVIFSDARGIYVGAPGSFGASGAIVLVRYVQDGVEVRMVARQTMLSGRYEWIDAPKLQVAPAAAGKVA